jgi:hypothetical protein
MPSVARQYTFTATALKWRALAYRRVLFMQELYHSGRWTHYYATEKEFGEHMLRAVEGAKIWARLAEASTASRRSRGDLLPAA